MQIITLSLAQMQIELGNQEANLEQAAHWISKAAGQGSDLILFPELWSTGYDLENWGRHAAPIDQGLFPRVAALAREYRIAVGGSLLEARGGRAFNTFVLYDQGGNLAGRYSKIHLFRLMEEHLWLAPGEELGIGQLYSSSKGDDPPSLQLGMGICYDLRFPELWRRYALSGIFIALIPAEWPVARVYHWRTLLRARAIENQMFVAATNNVGVTKNETFGGHSAVVDPWGETLIEGTDHEALLTIEIDLQIAAEVRERIPVFEDRRPEIYDR